jgi:hypothetical protein
MTIVLVAIVVIIFCLWLPLHLRLRRRQKRARKIARDAEEQGNWGFTDLSVDPLL